LILRIVLFSFRTFFISGLLLLVYILSLLVDSYLADAVVVKRSGVLLSVLFVKHLFSSLILLSWIVPSLKPLI
jgi:hypothetical protein